MQADSQGSRSITLGATHWYLWQSKAGSCYATRAGRLTDSQLLEGCAMTLCSDSQEGLTRLLEEQPDTSMRDTAS